MEQKNTFKPASIGEDCEAKLDRLESELSQENNKEIVLVAYEKK